MPPRTLDRLGDEIAELSVAPRCGHRPPARPHPRVRRPQRLEQRLPLLRRTGWPGAWGSTSGAARERVRVARALGTLPVPRAGARPRRAVVRQGPRADPRGHAGDRGAAAGRRPRGHRAARRAHRARLAAGGSPRRGARGGAPARGPRPARVSRTKTAWSSIRGPARARGRRRADAGAGRGARDARTSGAHAEPRAGRRPGAEAPTHGPAAGRRAGAARRDRAPPRARSRRPGRALPGRGPRRRRVLADADQPGQSVLEDGDARFRGNVAAPGVRRQPGGDAPRRRRPHRRRSAPGPARSRRRYGERSSIGTRAVASRAAGCRSAQGHHIHHWAHGGPTTLSNLRHAVSPSPPRRPRGGLPGRSRRRRRAAVPAAGWSRHTRCPAHRLAT